MFIRSIDLVLQAMLLSVESQAVIGLRFNKIAQGGPAAIVEIHRMITEKAAAISEATDTLLNGGTVSGVVRDLRGHVRANEARLLSRATIA
jgi:hypothetical protein